MSRESTGSSAARGPLTIVFTDAEGSTSMQTARGDQEGRAVLAACDTISRRQVEDHDGRVVKAMGDGLMICFQSPRQAVTCALAITREVAELGQRNPRLATRLRAGIHVGEVLEEAGDLHGAAVSAAARICAQAEGGEVLVSDVVRQLCGTIPGTAFWDRGRVALRGFPDRWQLFRVVPSVDMEGLSDGSTPFIGRDDRRATLRTALEKTIQGRGAMVMIGGEAGVGKTRLSQEFAREASERGFGVYVGHCYEAGADLPYMPWVEMLEGAARQLPADVLVEILGEHAPALALIAPELRRIAPSIPTMVELPGEQQRRYLFNGVREWLARAAAARPRLLILDDLHWADESTLLLVEHLMEAIERMPVLVIATYRDTTIDHTPSFSASLARLLRRPPVKLMSLAPHSEIEVAELLRVLAGDVPPREVAAAIYAESDGNAFFVEEVYRHLAESGKLLDERGRFRRDLQIDELEVPTSVRLVIERRIERLSEAARRALAVGAIMGRSFSFDTLQRVLETNPDELIDSLEAAERMKIIVEQSVGVDTHYRFAHELLRQTLLTQLSGPRRQRYHLRIAQVLERRYVESEERQAADIARHLLGAGGAADPLQTAHFLTLSGDRRRAAASFEEALRDYRQALDILPSGTERSRADLLFKIGVVERCLGHWEPALARWDEALTLLEKLGDGEAVGRLCFEITRLLMWAYRFMELVQIAYRGLAALGERETADVHRLRLMTALVLDLSGSADQSEPQIAAARAFAEATSDSRLLAEVANAETTHNYFLMQPEKTVTAGRQTAEAERRAGNLWVVSEALSWVDVGLVFQGRFAESAEVHRELDGLADRLGHHGSGGAARRNAFAACAATEADLDRLEKLARELQDIGRETGNAGWLGNSLTFQGIVDLWRGKWPEARAHMEEGVKLAGPFWAGTQHGQLLVVEALLGDRDRVHAHLDEVAGMLAHTGRPNLLSSWSLAIHAAEAIGLVGGAERAKALYPIVLEAMATGAVLRHSDGRLIETSAAMAAAAAGLDDEAVRHFESALVRAERLPHRLEQPHVRHAYARFLVERGDRTRAKTLLGSAIDAYKSIGMPRHASSASELRARCD